VANPGNALVFGFICRQTGGLVIGLGRDVFHTGKIANLPVGRYAHLFATGGCGPCLPTRHPPAAVLDVVKHALRAPLTRWL
jgi:hypothetical protein